MVFPDVFGKSGGSGAPRTAVTLATDSAPSWESLWESVQATETGAALAAAAQLRAEGKGAAHTDALLRLFDASSEADVRVTLYRDDAAWCPYCQKVWLLLEEKRIPFKVSKINMRSYGDKPAWFMQLVRGGFLPVIELDGKVITESLVIMQTLDATFPEGPPMVPPPGSPMRQRAQELLGLERQLFGAWCSLTFQPGKGLFDANERSFVQTLQKVDAELQATEGPWFLGGDAPSLVDLQYISHVERMLASLLYWKGMRLRDTGTYPGLDAWLAAFEARPAYLASKSDYYTHVKDIPPQYGDGYGIDAAADAAARIDGSGSSAWTLPLRLDSAELLEPLAPLQYAGADEAAKHEAAYELASNHEAVVRFAARGAGQPGGWAGPGKAELADPYAKPNEAIIDAVDTSLRHVGAILLDDGADAVAELSEDLKAASGTEGGRSLAACLAYLRDRIGVPRDMGQAAAMQLRAHLNLAIAELQ